MKSPRLITVDERPHPCQSCRWNRNIGKILVVRSMPLLSSEHPRNGSLPWSDLSLTMRLQPSPANEDRAKSGQRYHCNRGARLNLLPQKYPGVVKHSMVEEAGSSCDGDNDHDHTEAKECPEPELLMRFDLHSPEQQDRDYKDCLEVKRLL